MAPGTLITLEGIDGAGKSTLARAIRASLVDRGVNVELLREPGGVGTAEAIRELVHDPARTIGARAEALLFAAARAQLIEELIKPRLAAGAFLLVDRFVDSSLVYQGSGRGLGLSAVAEINRFATDGLVADRTLLLDLDPELARARSGARGEMSDRFEQESVTFFAGIASAYRKLAETEPTRVRVLDASQPPERMLADALAEIADLLP
ncbi:MAG TPA: dTMP kinase [Solirubrobacteraceae bacterium]|nr:dTMP kinase [Solirubrobacteraceae bacterium]